MKIVADNRGRVALTKLAHDKLSHDFSASEWDATVESGRIIFERWDEEPEPEWVKIYPEGLHPDLIGQVVGVYAVADNYGPRTPYDSELEGTWGVLKAYSKSGSFIEVILDCGNVISENTAPGIGDPDKPRLQHLWIRNPKA